MQRKLTRDELRLANRAAWYLRSAMNHCGLIANGGSVLDQLCEMEAHGTTDGKPWVEPQAEIGEGYRLATEADKDRQDREMHDVHGRWVPAHVGIHAGSYTYRVPKDRIPTDEDAVGRPMVMVRDRIDGEAWQPGKLIEVDPSQCQEFWARVVGAQESFWWDECRFPYPGELP